MSFIEVNQNVQNAVLRLSTKNKLNYKQRTNMMFNSVFSFWKTEMINFWENPEANLLELGTEAKAFFEISHKTVLFLESINPGCTEQILLLRKPVTFADDGSGALLEE